MLSVSKMYQTAYELPTANETNSVVQKMPIKMDKLKMTRILMNANKTKLFTSDKSSSNTLLIAYLPLFCGTGWSVSIQYMRISGH